MNFKQKILAACCLIFLQSPSAMANCLESGIVLWPGGETIKKNSVFVIEGYVDTVTIIPNLNKKYPIYLLSRGNKVNLKIKEILGAGSANSQAVLVPEKELIPGEEYQLIIEGLSDDERQITKWESTSIKKEENIKWRVEKEIDTKSPIWIKKPIETKKTYIEYGCGPEIYIHFSQNVTDTSAFIVRATVTEVKSKKPVTRFIMLEDPQTIKVGHGMCSGEFSFYEGNEFEVSFELMDASGNITPWSDKKIKFIKPLVETDE